MLHANPSKSEHDLSGEQVHDVVLQVAVNTPTISIVKRKLPTPAL
jgi:hypothetical protein